MRIDLNNTPQGTWIKQENGTVVIGSILRHIGVISSLLLPIILTGLVLFIALTLFTDGFNLFGTIFGCSIFLVSLWFWKNVGLSIFGKVEITLGHEEGSIFSGIKQLGSTQKFQYKDIHTIEKYVFITENERPKYAIRLVDHKGKSIRFGHYMKADRRDFLISTIRAFMVDGDQVRDNLEPDFINHLIE